MPDRIDVPLHEVAAETAVNAKRTFEVDQLAVCDSTERGDPRRFRPDIGVHFAVLGDEDRQAHAVDGQAVARRELWRQRGGNPQPEPTARRPPLDELAHRFNEAREHSLQS
jgi:hypothetical protein